MVVNRKAKLLTKYLRVVLEPISYAIFWGHRGFWRPTLNFYARDGVHLNSLGQKKYHRSLRGAILTQCVFGVLRWLTDVSCLLLITLSWSVLSINRHPNTNSL